MGEWVNTAFIEEPNTARLADALESVFADEGYTRIEAPDERRPEQRDVMQYGDALSSRRWAVALIPGARGWHAVVTAPFEVLCERPEGGDRPRLADITEALAARGFQYNLYDSTAIALVECDGRGDYLISGCRMSGGHPLHVFSEDVPEERAMADFELIDVPDRLQSGDASSADRIHLIAEHFGGAFSDELNNSIQGTYLVPHRRLEQPGVDVLYFERQEHAERVDPLECAAAHRKLARGGRLELTAGAGRAALEWGEGADQHDTILPGWGGKIRWRDREEADAFVSEVAAWLGRDLPEPPATPGVPTGLRYSISRLDSHSSHGKNGWHTYSLLLGTSPRAALGLRVREGFQRGELIELDTAHRDTIVRGLTTALRDGPERAKLPESWEVEATPLVDEFGFLSRGYFLKSAIGEDWFAATRLGAQAGELVRWNDPKADEKLVARFDGTVSELQAAPHGSKVAVILVDPSRPGSIGGDDPAALIICDVETGETKKLVESGKVGSFAELCWSPDGNYLAVELAGATEERIGIISCERGGVVERIPLDGADLLRWGAGGVLLRIRKPHPTSWFEAQIWNPDTSKLEAVSSERAISPNGEYDVSTDDEQLVVTGPDGLENTRPLGEMSYRSPKPGFPGRWLDDRRVVLDGPEPIVLDCATLEMRYLLPRTRVREWERRGGRVLFSPVQGEVWWGSVSDLR